jgi:hypothetical protein
VACLSSARTGQADAQAGSTQCMHWRFTNRVVPSALGVGFTTVKHSGPVVRVPA